MDAPFYKFVVVTGLTILALNTAAADQGKGGMGDMGGMKMDGIESNKDSASNVGVNEGEVKSVDKDKKSITLKHGPVKSETVEMSPMTMSFPVKDAALLARVKVGDKVKFNIENIKNTATVTSLQVQKKRH
ncbi:copper-binding protein [Herbaspirillum sp. GCM10030257]|uniref:copper-binding protein n=1 Tax=Herbaspirillum sp. GCM10030257 TaxID=3273393 RepID=UPI00360BCA3F